MSEAPARRFTLGDAMVLVAALTPSLVLIRFGVKLGLFEFGKLTEAGGRTAPLARQVIEIFNAAGGCVLAGLVPAVLILGLYRARPSAREAAQGPGLVACLVALAATFFPLCDFATNVLIALRSPEPDFTVPFNNVFGRWMFAAGPMILGAWLALLVLGRWKVRPTWADRFGCVLGFVFILLNVYAESYFTLISPIQYLLKP